MKELNTVALIKDIPEKKLSTGQVGTIVEKLDADTFEIEFSNADGETFRSVPLKKSNLMLLRFEPASA